MYLLLSFYDSISAIKLTDHLRLIVSTEFLKKLLVFVLEQMFIGLSHWYEQNCFVDHHWLFEKVLENFI